MLKTKLEFTMFGEITNWGEGGKLERFLVTERTSDSDFALEELQKIGLDLGDVVVIGVVSANGETGITFAIAQADLERDAVKEELWDAMCYAAQQNGTVETFWKENPITFGVDTVDLENIIDSNIADMEVETIVEDWIKANCTHFVIDRF